MTQEMNWQISEPGRVLVTIYPDGRVVKNPDISWDECAEKFWDAVERGRANRSWVQENHR